MDVKPCGRTYQSLPLLEEPCPCWWSWRKASIRWLFRESPCEGVWKCGRVQEKDERRNGCDPGKWMGLACMFFFSKAFKWITYLLFVSQGYNASSGKLEIVTTANQDPLLCTPYHFMSLVFKLIVTVSSSRPHHWHWCLGTCEPHFLPVSIFTHAYLDTS